MNNRDTPLHKGHRARLVEELRDKGIHDEFVLRAIGEIPRHLFIESMFADHAYEDKAFPIASGQTISMPYTVAHQSQLLESQPGMKVLEIGTGSGYQTCVLQKLGLDVYTIERQQKLFKQTERLLGSLGVRPRRLIYGDGYKGLPEVAPFDRILVTAGAAELPQALLGQLAVGGRLVIPLGSEEQIMHVFVRKDAETFTRQTFGSCKFVPLLEHKN